MRQKASLTLVVICVMGLFAASCGDDDGGNASDDSGATDDVGGAGTEDAADGDSAEDPDADDTDEAGDAPESVTITHYSGTTEVPYQPETVVVMDLGILVTLDALGVEAAGFGSLGTPVPEEYQALVDAPESVGTAWEPDFEAINALEPDLIIVATRSSAAYDAMSEIAPTVDLTQPGEGDFFAEFSDVHQSIADIFGVQAEVDAALAEIQSGIDEVAAQAPDAGDALVVMTSGAEVSAFGPGSWRFGLVHDLYGYGAAEESLARDETHGEVVSFEFIAEAAPDVMFVVDRAAAVGEEGDAAEAILDTELVTSTPAWTNDRVVYADSFAWYIINNSIPGFLSTTDDMVAGLG